HDRAARARAFQCGVPWGPGNPTAFFAAAPPPRPARGLGGHEAAGPAALLVRAGDPITAQHERILSTQRTSSITGSPPLHDRVNVGRGEGDGRPDPQATPGG